MVRLIPSTVAVAFLAGSALAIPAGQYERREFVNDFEERSPLGLGLLFKGIKGAVKVGENAIQAHQSNQQQKRAYDDLEERSPLGLGLLFKGIKGAVKVGEHALQGHQNNNQQKRAFDDTDDVFVSREDLEERSPLGFGLLFKGIKGAVKVGEHALQGNQNNNQQKRAFDDFDGVVVTREDLDELFGREFVSDIEERSPFGLGLLFKGIKGAVKLGEHAAHAHNNNNNNKRDFEEEMFERGYYDDVELLEREYYDELD